MNDPNSKMLLLTEEEHAFLLDLVLDYGSYAGSKPVRNRLARKLVKPSPIRDVGWFGSRGRSKRARAVRQLLAPSRPAT